MLKQTITQKATALLVAILAYSLIFPAYIFALPQGAQVVAGQADITNPSAQAMQINQATQKAIINWQQFSIAAPEAVNFTQPNAAAIALNRVVGVDPSLIYGSLTANGGVWVINPAGVLVGSTGIINVNSFLASTLDIANEDFLSGNYTFSQRLNESLASIVNQGTISAASGGSVSLIAPGVVNQGTIVASLGKVNLGAGEQVTLNFQGNELINFAVDKSVLGEVLGPDGQPLEDSILNEGTISAEGGEIVLSARTAYDAIKSVVNNKGVIEAQTVENENGAIRLQGNDLGIVYNSGTLDVSGLDEGETGGEVEVTGEKTGLVHYSKIKASGRKGGGKVFIGGGFQGKNPSIKNGKITYVGKDATIEADAIDEGNGGEVIVWADDITRFYGDISAKGGALVGDGGLVETSGKNYLEAIGIVNASAPAGNAGTWLLDPKDIDLIDVASSTQGSFDGGSPTDTFSPFISTNPSWVDNQKAQADVSQIISTLQGGTNVTITTTEASDPDDMAGNITVVDSISVAVTNNDVTFTLDADNDIYVNNSISETGGSFALNIDFQADNDIIFNSNGDIATNDGNVNLLADANGDANGSGGAITMVNGTVVNAGAGTITLDADESIALGSLETTNATTNAVLITTNASVTDGTGGLATNITADDASADVTLTVGGDIGAVTNILDETGLAAVTTDVADLRLTSGGVIAVTETDTAVLTTLNANNGGAGKVLVKAAGALDASGTTGFEAADDIGLVSSGGLVTVVTSLDATNLRLEGTDVADSDGGAIDLDATNILFKSGAAETLTITTAGGDFDGTAGGAFSVTNDGGALDLADLDGDNTALTTASGFGLTVVTNGTLTVADDVTAAGVGTIDLTGNGISLTTAAGDPVTVSAVDGLLTVNSGSGTLTLEDEGDTTIALLTTTGTGDISITAGGLVIETNDATDQAQIVAGGSLLMDSGAGQTIGIGDDAIAAVSDLEMSDAEIEALSSGGTLTIGSTNSGRILIDLASSFSGDLILVTGSTIDDNSAAGIAFQSTGTLTLTSNGAIGGDLTNGPLNVDVGNLVVTSSGGNNVTLTDTGIGGDTNYTIATGGAGNVKITQSTNDIVVVDIATTENITFNAAGTITAAGGADDDVDIVATNVIVEAATGFGSAANVLDLDADTSDITASGDVYFDVVGSGGHATTIDLSAGDIEIDGRNTAGGAGYETITLSNVDTDNGTVTVYNYDSNIIATLLDNSGTDQDVRLETVNAGDIEVDQIISNAAADIRLDAVGAITGVDGADDTADITGGNLIVEAATQFGQGNTLDFDLTTSDITSAGPVTFDVVGGGGHSTIIDVATGAILIDGRNESDGGSFEDITLTNVDTDNGTVTVYNSSNNIIATLLDNSATDQDVRLETVNSGDIDYRSNHLECGG